MSGGYRGLGDEERGVQEHGDLPDGQRLQGTYYKQIPSYKEQLHFDVPFRKSSQKSSTTPRRRWARGTTNASRHGTRATWHQCAAPRGRNHYVSYLTTA